MAYEKTIESLYDEEEEEGTEDGLGLMNPHDLQDPDEIENGEEDEEAALFNNPELYMNQDDDPGNEFQEEEGEDNSEITNNLDENQIINDLLKDKGINDPKSIKYENDAGEIEEVDFYSLPYEDQLSILKTDTADAPTYTDHELEVVDFLRTQNATFDDVIAFAQRQAVEDYIRDSSGQGFVVDDYEDDELYLMDLKLKYENLTEEELQLELEKELQHEDLFKKKVERLRQEYVTLETEQREFKTQSEQDKEKEDFEALSTNVVNAAIATIDIGGLTLDDDDRNSIIHSVLEKDINGTSKFIKGLDNPETLFKLAWFAEKGDEAFEIIHDYYKKQIDDVRKTSYAKGKADAKPAKAAVASGGKQSHIRQPETKGKASKSIDDLYD